MYSQEVEQDAGAELHPSIRNLSIPLVSLILVYLLMNYTIGRASLKTTGGIVDNK